MTTDAQRTTRIDPAIAIGATRGGTIESRHNVHGVLAAPDGALEHIWGNGALIMFPRSAFKAMQALPLVESGAADAFQLPEEALSMACASHNSEPVHVDLAGAWVEKIGLSVADFGCGAHWPRLHDDLAAMISAGEKPDGRHNNCSGKHAGMLTVAQHLGAPVETYLNRDHPVQQAISDAVSELSDFDLGATDWGVDGCSAPNPSMPLASLAIAAARVAEANAGRLGRVRADACERLLTAQGKFPYHIAGRERLDTELARATDGRIIAKIGADGVYVVYFRDLKRGLALKSEAGTDAGLYGGLWEVFSILGLLDDRVKAALAPYCRPEIRNWKGSAVGEYLTITG